jgi:hypothetical protein
MEDGSSRLGGSRRDPARERNGRRSASGGRSRIKGDEEGLCLVLHPLLTPVIPAREPRSRIKAGRASHFENNGPDNPIESPCLYRVIILSL